MKEEKNKVETVLFTTGRFLDIQDISKMCGIGSQGYVKELLIDLKKDYDSKEGALEITEQGSKWKIGIRKNYLYLTETLLTDSELDKPTQETLAVIAYKNPALQSEIIKIRGNKAYGHIKLLQELDFVASEITGRTRQLKLTQKFYDYFDVVADQLKSKIDLAVEQEKETTQEMPTTEDSSLGENNETK